MRIVSLLMGSALSAMTLAACGGATASVPADGTGAGTNTGTGTGSDPGSSAGTVNGNDPGNDLPQPGVHRPAQGGVIGATCATPTRVLVAPNGLISRPDGSALRLQVVYQGSELGVTDVRGVDMILPPSDGPFKAGAVSGYWFETRRTGADTSPTYQHLFQDPTNQEAAPGPNGGGFGNSTLDRCTPKYISVDVPNNAGFTELAVFGSPYGTQDPAVELGRFSITISTK